MTRARQTLAKKREITGSIRAVMAPDRITKAREALEAFRRVVQYREAGLAAYTRYMGTAGGSRTAEANREKYEKYSEVVDGWERVLEEWLRDQANMERGRR